MRLRRFQKRFLFGAFADGVRTACLSIPRGNGKTSLAAELGLRILSPGSALFQAGTESHLVSASLGQSRRTAFRVLKSLVEARPDYADGAFRISENRNECAITHLATDTRLSVLAPKSATAQGLLGCPWVICDEPGAWEVIGGEAMHEAIQTAMGKPDSPLRALYLGTLAPQKGAWWPALIARGSSESRYVMLLQADPKKWDALSELKRVNPLVWEFPASRKVLRDELEDAKRDESARASYCSYRLNIPTRSELEMLLSVPEWEPIEDVDASGLGERIGALAISIAPSQPAPVYTPESDVPDQAVVRILLEQLISPKLADRDDPLVCRRREIVALLGPMNGIIS